MSRRRRTLIAAAMPLALALPLAAAPPAVAGETVTLSTYNKTPHTAGYAKTQLKVRFPSKKAYDVQGWVSDMCPGDGWGAYVYVERTASGPAGSTYSDRRRVGQDANGCGNGRSRFDPGPVKYETKLTGIRIQLCEWDGSEGGGASCTWRSISNWRNQ